MMMKVVSDLRDRLLPVRDQGPRPTCLVLAVSAAHEHSVAAEDHLSVEYLFHAGVRRSHGDPGRGLSTKSTCLALKEDGQPSESCWPYLAGTPDPADWKPPPISSELRRSNIDFTSSTVDELRQLVCSGRTAVVVMSVSLALYKPGPGGIVRGADSDTITARRHAVVAVGAGEMDGAGYTLVRNSWGSAWGDAGHAWLHDEYLNTHLISVGTLSLPS